MNIDLRKICCQVAKYHKHLRTVSIRFLPEAQAANDQRLYSMSIVAALISLVSVQLFLLTSAELSPAEFVWNRALIIAHSSFVLVMFTFALVSRLQLRSRRKWKSGYWLQLSAVQTILLFGIAISAIDQLVTPNISPFILACIISSAIFLIRPLHAIIIYLASYLIFIFVIGITQTNQSMLFSNRINALTAVGTGIFLSFVMWNYFIANALQKDTIESQKKDLEEKNKELAILATLDHMTGLINRRQFELISINELVRSRANNHTSTIIIADIDYFKEINDSFGHPVGDTLLKKISNVLTDNLRSADVVSRWGGDEFVILLPETALEMGQIVAEKLRSVIEKHEFDILGVNLRVTASFGVAVMQETFMKSYRNADTALYHAKKDCRNKVVAFQSWEAAAPTLAGADDSAVS